MDKSKNISLFPYQIKNVESFYHRNHPKNSHPSSLKFNNYWKDFLKKMIEGNWVNDDGTWVYMMPKLFFYVNYPLIPDRKRDEIHPDLRDNEWIIFTYLLCVEGFSGFELDEDITCNHLVGRYEKDPESLNIIELGKIPDNAKRADGTYKKFIDPWEYLTKYYLLERPLEFPLGQALYDNQRHNGCILSARGIGKSLCMFVGDFLHEFLTSGVKRYSEISSSNKRLLFGMGSSMKPQLQRSINNVKSAYYKMPGQFKFSDKDLSQYMGPFYKRVQGSWEVGAEINHIVKSDPNTVDIQGSSLQMVVLTKDRTKVGAGDRFRRIYIEEYGFLENAIDVHASNKDSLISEGEPVGSAMYLGTSGDMQTIRQPKAIFEHPSVYNIYGIPHYWKNPEKRIGLFIPKTYALRDYKDKNGNTIMDLAFEHVIKTRDDNKKDMDSVSYELDIMFNPLVPEEMLRPGNSSLLPKQEAQEQLNTIEAYDLFKKKAQIGRLIWDPLNVRGVDWRKDLNNNLKPILETRIDDSTSNTNKEGAIIIYEQPPDYIPEGLYWVVYDPAAKSGSGESFHSAIVYKYFYSGAEKSLYDTVVGEWIGRKETLDDNYQEVIKLAKYFNARIFPEINVAGFVEFCRKNNYWNLLEPDAYNLEQEIHGKSAITRSYYKVGFQMNKRKKNWCLKKLRDWLLEVKEFDVITGTPTLRTIDWIFSPRILNEVVEYVDDPSENFDHISSLLGLMLLIGKLDGSNPVDLSDDDDSEAFDSTLIPYINYSQNVESNDRCTFLKY